MSQRYTKMNPDEVAYDSEIEDVDIMPEEEPKQEVKPQKYKNKKGDLKKKKSIAQQNLAKGRAKKAEMQAKKREVEANRTKYTVTHEEDQSEDEQQEAELGSDNDEQDDLEEFVLSKQAKKQKPIIQKQKPKAPVENPFDARLEKLEQVMLQLVQLEKKKKPAKKAKAKAVVKKETNIYLQPEKKPEVPVDIFAEFKSRYNK
jgi:hypothetical protein